MAKRAAFQLLLEGLVSLLVPLTIAELAKEVGNGNVYACSSGLYAPAGTNAMLGVTAPLAFVAHAARVFKLTAKGVDYEGGAKKGFLLLFFMFWSYLFTSCLVAFQAAAVTAWHEYYYCLAMDTPKGGGDPDSPPTTGFTNHSLAFAFCTFFATFSFQCVEKYYNPVEEVGKMAVGDDDRL
jgi:hypothetical protein